MSWLRKEAAVPMEIEEARKVFQQQLKIIAWMPLSKEVFIEDVNPTRKNIRAAYREIKKRDLNMGFIDFFCWISTQEIATLVKKHHSVEPIFKVLEYWIECESIEARNMLRLFRKKPFYFLDELEIINQEKKRDLFLKLNCLWYDTVKRESV